MDSYEEVFKDYPYNKLLESLGDGRVDLNTNSVEIGQIYLVVRKKRYFQDESEDLSMVEKILPIQLKTMYSSPVENPYTSEPLNLGTLPNGLVIRPLDTTDTFIMSCYGGSGLGIYDDNGRINMLMVRDGVGVEKNNRKSTMYFKYVNLEDLQYFWRQMLNQNIYIEMFQSEGDYTTSMKNLSKWGYIFKIPIGTPKNQFMNWTSNPFI